MFKRNGNKKQNMKKELPNVFLDGLVEGQLQGWAQGVDTANLSLCGEKLVEVTCQDYRADLDGILDNPNASFCYSLSKEDIKKAWHHLPSITLHVEFMLEGKLVHVAECELSIEKLAEQLGFVDLSNTALRSFDGVTGQMLSGWCYQSDYVELFIDHEYIGTVTCEAERPDLMVNTQCGFQYTLDGADLKAHWFLKDNVTLTAIFKADNTETVLDKRILTISSAELLSAVETIKNMSIQEISLIIEESHLWDEHYYLSQLGENEICHPNKLYDFILKGAASGKNPNPYFNTYYYLANNPDIAKDGVNPFYHYIITGEQEGRRPTPSFDPKLYLESNPDLAGWEAPLLAHLLMAGLVEGRVYNEHIRPVNTGMNVDPYLTWRLNNEKNEFIKTQQDLLAFESTPCISIVVPVYNPDKQLLIDCIESVIAQSYTNWQLCLADDKSTEPYVKQVLKEYRLKDNRIKPVFRRKNGHISAASNSALEVATGEWTALLDHDDLLHEHALYHVAKAINDNPDVALIYSDEDKINLEGERVDPHFKSDWNLDLLYSQNYVSHLGVYKTDIIKKIGGFRKGYEGSQDYDLLLRYSREIDHANIIHIPKVLYHWRIVEGSTALASGEKSYTTDAGIKALQDHFEVLNEDVVVEEGPGPNMYKVNWQIAIEPLVSLIIPTYNGYEITKQAIDSILEKTTYQNYEILLVDNNSNDPIALTYFEELDKHDKVTVLRYPYPFNYSAINNFAAKQAKGEIIGLVNNDVEVITPEWLTEMVSHAQRKDVGCVGAMLYFENDTIQHAGVITGLGGVAGHSHKHFPKDHPGYFYRLKLVQNLSAVTAACLMIKKTAFDEVNGLNEEDLTVAFNDVDFCLKVQAAGYRNLWTPYAELYHYESISRGAEDNPVKVARFNKEVSYMKNTWKTDKQADPCYSPNLTTDREDFSVGR